MSTILAPTGALPRLAYVSQILLGAYGARFSYIAITKLREYEALTKKAAEWTSVAQEHLDKTRTTQGAGAGALLLSLLASTTLLFGSRFDLPSWTGIVVSPLVLVAIVALRSHVRNYWAPYKDSQGRDVAGMRVPLPRMQDYNQAEVMTERLLEVLRYLEFSWVGVGILAGVGVLF